MCPANVVIHFSDFLELPRPIVAADFTHRQSGVEQLHEALWVQLQIAEQRFHTWKNIKNVKISKTLGVVVVCWILECFLGNLGWISVIYTIVLLNQIRINTSDFIRWFSYFNATFAPVVSFYLFSKFICLSVIWSSNCFGFSFLAFCFQRIQRTSH